jgi:dynein heavy chain
MRRSVFVTPKSYLGYVSMYKQFYKQNFDAIDVEESQVVNGLSTLDDANIQIKTLIAILVDKARELGV